MSSGSFTWAETSGVTELPASPSRERQADVTDWQLLAEAKRRPAVVGRLFERHRDYVYRLAWGFLADPTRADDVVQEVFTRLLASRRHYLRRARFTTFLYQVTLNVCREQRRRAQREVLAADPEPAGSNRPASVPELLDLRVALTHLPQRQREVVVLRYLEGLSTAETAAIMRCRNGTVKAHLHRALRALGIALKPARPQTDNS